MCTPACSALILKSFMLISKLASPQMKSGMESVEESQFPRLLRRLAEAGSLERMLCVKELAKWQNTVGGFIIIFLLLCMYNDCPHYKTQDDVHNYITPDSAETGASIIHYSWYLFDNMVIFCSFEMTDWLSNMWYFANNIRWHLLINVVNIIHTVYNMFVRYCSFWDKMNAIFFVGA